MSDLSIFLDCKHYCFPFYIIFLWRNVYMFRYINFFMYIHCIISLKHDLNSNAFTNQLKPCLTVHKIMCNTLCSPITHVDHTYGLPMNINIHAFERQVIDITYLVQQLTLAFIQWYRHIEYTNTAHHFSYPLCAVFLNLPKTTKFLLAL